MEKFFEEVCGHRSTVFGGAANVIDRSGLCKDGSASGGDCCGCYWLVQKRLFGSGETSRVFAQAGRSDPDVLDNGRIAAFVHMGKNSNGHLGDSLSVPRAYLADVGFVTP